MKILLRCNRSLIPFPWTLRVGERDCASARAAFTLLEMLIALSLVAILSVSMFASMRIAFKARASSEDAVAPGRTSELAMELLRADIEAAVPPTGTLAGAFTGTNTVLDFYSVAASPVHDYANGEIKLVELAMEPGTGSDGDQLVRRVTRNLLAQVAPDPDVQVLCRRVTSFSMQYFDGSQWQNSWDSTQYSNTLPSAVQVTLELQVPQSSGQMRAMRYVRIFALSCSTTLPGSNGTAGGTGSSGLGSGMSF